jgi:putative tryptophan/tyrosine transport system ATP-binding protein
MMSEGKIILDVSGEEKQRLTVEELIKKFNIAGDILADDMLLAK